MVIHPSRDLSKKNDLAMFFFFRENPNLKWMTAESTSIFFGNHHIVKSNVNDLIGSGEVRCHICSLTFNKNMKKQHYDRWILDDDRYPSD